MKKTFRSAIFKPIRILIIALIVFITLGIGVMATGSETVSEGIEAGSESAESTVDVSAYGDPVETWDISATESDSVTANLYNDSDNAGYYILVIDGSGNMKMWSIRYKVPWYSSYCTKIKSVIIGDGITNIGCCAFYECVRLESIKIPDSVTSIGYEAFYSCASLTSITIPDGVTKIDFATFEYCEKLERVTFGNGVKSIESTAFRNCESITGITIPDSVTSIGSFAFENCDSLKAVIISDSVAKIGDSAFSRCSALSNVTVGSAVTSIGMSAFNECLNLKLVYINSAQIASAVTSSSSAGYIANYAKTIAIPADITNIGSYITANFTLVDTITYTDVDGATVTYNLYAKHTHAEDSTNWVDISVSPTASDCGFSGYECSECGVKKGIELSIPGCEREVFEGAKYNLTMTTSFLGSFYVKVPSADDIYTVNVDSIPGYKGTATIGGVEYYVFTLGPSVSDITSDICFNISTSFAGVAVDLVATFTTDSYFAAVMEKYSGVAEPSAAEIENMVLVMNAAQYANELYKLINGVGYDKYETILNNEAYKAYLTDLSAMNVESESIKNIEGIDNVITSASLKIHDSYYASFVFYVTEEYVNETLGVKSVAVSYKNIAGEEVTRELAFRTGTARESTYYYLEAGDMPIYDMLSTQVVIVEYENGETVSGEYNLAAYAQSSDSRIGYALYAYAEASYEYKVVRASER